MATIYDLIAPAVSDGPASAENRYGVPDCFFQRMATIYDLIAPAVSDGPASAENRYGVPDCFFSEGAFASQVQR